MTMAAAVNTGYQLSQDKDYNLYDLLQTELSTVLTRNRTLGQQVSINIGISTLSAENDEDYGWKALGAVSGTLGSSYMGRFTFGGNYTNQFLRPMLSNTVGEFLGDSENIKSNINRVDSIINEKGVESENR